MNQPRALLINASEYDTSSLLAEWHWVVPEFATPLFISAFGDWVFGHPDGSLWMLSLLDADYRLVAENSAEYNTLNKSAEWIEKTFLGAWHAFSKKTRKTPKSDIDLASGRVHAVIAERRKQQK